MDEYQISILLISRELRILWFQKAILSYIESSELMLTEWMLIELMQIELESLVLNQR